MRIDSAIITGSFSVNGDTFNDLGSYSTTGSNTFVGDQSIVGAISASALTGSIDFTNLTGVPTLVSGSDQIVDILSPLNSYTQSNDTTNTTQTNRLNSLEEKTGSLATTGSNTFYGTQTFTGSVYISENLIVQGSSSLQNITASAVDIGTNKIILNVDNPAVRYAGISVYDSGSTGGTGSLWWDSVENHWLYEHPSDSAAPYNSAILISGPKNEGNLGEELELVNNYIVKAVGGDHISSSAIYDDGTTIALKSNTEISGTLKVTSIVGIGTANPKSYSALTTNGQLISLNNIGVDVNQSFRLNNYYNSGTTSDRTISNGYASSIGLDNTNGGLTFNISSTSASADTNISVIEGMRITKNGNVGIGDDNPGETLVLKKASYPTIKLIETTDNFSGYLQYHSEANEFRLLTITNHPLIFSTNDTERMRIASGGNVGIGITSPFTKLTVNGVVSAINSGVDATFADAFVGVYSSNNNEQNAIQTSVSSVAQSSGFRFQASNGGGSTGRTNVVDFRRDRALFYTNVGIGTVSADVKLHIVDTATSSGEVARFQRNLDQINEYAYIKVGNSSYPAYFGAMLGTYDMAYMSMSPDPTDGKALSIRTTDGNVGIGVTNPSSKLHVNGNIKYGSRVFSGNAIIGNISSNLNAANGTNYILLYNLNETAGWSLVGHCNAASWTTWNISQIWIKKDYDSRVSSAGITGLYKSGGCDMTIVDLNYSGGRYVAIGYTSNPEIDVVWTGYSLLNQFQSDGSANIVAASQVSVNSTLASY